MLNPAEQKIKRFVLITALFAAFIFFTTTMNQLAEQSFAARFITALILAALAFGAIWVVYYIFSFVIGLFRRKN